MKDPQTKDPETAVTTPPAPSVHNRANPFKARLTENTILSGAGSNKDTRHLVINLAGSGISYVPGDSYLCGTEDRVP